MSEVGPFLLLLCQLTFSLNEPPPAEALDMLAAAYHCDARVEVNFEGRVAPRADGAPAYFPSPPKYWPVVSAGDPELEAKVAGWIEQGIRPGLLLPPDPIALALRFADLARLQSAEGLGAIPVLPVARPLQGSVTYGATIYAALGLAPHAVYVTDGYGLDLALLPAGRHLVAAHWHAPYESIPVPARQLSLGPSLFVAVFDGPSPGGGVYATTSDGRGPAYTPDLRLQWSFHGVAFSAGESGLDTDTGGQLLLGLVRASSIMWAVIGGNWPNLLTGIVALLAWVGIILAALLFFILPFGVVISRFRRVHH